MTEQRRTFLLHCKKRWSDQVTRKYVWIAAAAGSLALTVWWLRTGPSEQAQLLDASGGGSTQTELTDQVLRVQVGRPLEHRTDLNFEAASVDASRSPPTCALTVTTSWQTGDPAVEVALLLQHSSSSTPVLGRSDDFGRHRFEGLETGSWTLICARGGRRSLELHPGENSTALQLIEGRTVDVLVVDTKGSGIADAHIVLSTHGEDTWAVVAGSTDIQGQLRLRDIGDDRSISARKLGYEPSPCIPIGVGTDNDPATVEIRLLAGGTSVEGRVRDESDGLPIPGTRVRARGGSRRMAEPEERGGASIKAIYERPAPIDTATDAAGAFRLAGLPSGTIELQFVAAGYATERRFVEVPNIGAHAWVDVDLKRRERVDGIVLSADGTPAADILVWAGAPRGSGSRHTYSDEEGRFLFQELESGISVLEAWGPFGLHAAAAIDAADRNATLQLRLSRSEAPTGKLQGADGVPLPGWAVSREAPFPGDAPPPRTVIARTDSMGRFWLRPGDSEPGPVWFWSPMTAAPFPVASRDLTDDGHLGVVTIDRTGAWCAIEFHALESGTDLGERPVIVGVMQLESGWSIAKVVESDAVTRVEGLVPGDYALRYVLAPDNEHEAGTVPLAAGRTLRVDVPATERTQALPNAR